ncbi:MAG: glycosyltransferase family 4 protein [Opitutales bacterium]|nr:glycosyltransferase family 4 protein [Opitutales bacterium]
MKICFINSLSYSQNPSLKRATGMAPALADLGYSVSIVLEGSEENKKKIQEDCPDIEAIFYPPGLSRNSERNWKNHILQKISPDLVYICTVNRRNWVKQPSPKAKIIAEHNELQSVIKNKGLRRYLDLLFEWGHLLSFDAHLLASRYLQKVYDKRLRCLGLKSPTLYQPFAFGENNEKIQVELLTSLKGKYPADKTFLYMGSFWENYGFWDMLKAFQKLAKSAKDFQFLLSGKGPEKERGMQWVEENGLQEQIRFLGYLPDAELATYFAFADAFLCPLRDTAQDKARCPSKLFMYIPFQKPIITCKIGEAWELLREKGTYYSPGNSDDLYERLLEFVNNPLPTLGIDLGKHTWKARALEFDHWVRNDLKNA